jgi:hypothetical protein
MPGDPEELAMIVADTDLLIAYLRGERSQAERIALELQHGLATTVVTAFESSRWTPRTRVAPPRSDATSSGPDERSGWPTRCSQGSASGTGRS